MHREVDKFYMLSSHSIQLTHILGVLQHMQSWEQVFQELPISEGHQKLMQVLILTHQYIFNAPNNL